MLRPTGKQANQFHMEMCPVSWNALWQSGDGVGFLAQRESEQWEPRLLNESRAPVCLDLKGNFQVPGYYFQSCHDKLSQKKIKKNKNKYK